MKMYRGHDVATVLRQTGDYGGNAEASLANTTHQ